MKDKGLNFGHAEFEVSINTPVEMSMGVGCAPRELSTNSYTRHLDLSCQRTLATLQTMGRETINPRSMSDGNRRETRT